jgi:uncharacterized protein YndB with AHSA1/START domain
VRSDELSLELTQLFSAPPARVFELFIDAAEVAKWWGPRGFSIRSIDFAPRVGGAYRIDMQPPEGEAFQLTGTFRDVDPPSRLAFSFEWEPADPDDVETLAQLSFQAIDDSTEVLFTQGPFKTEERRALHREGWTESFQKLSELVSQQR